MRSDNSSRQVVLFSQKGLGSDWCAVTITLHWWHFPIAVYIVWTVWLMVTLAYLAKSFVNLEKIRMTKELNVAKLSVEEIALVCHNVNKAYCSALGDMSQPEWELAPEWQRNSAISGVKAHINSGLTMLPEDSHISWKKQKESEGWTYGPTKNSVLKQHPCMVEYKDLPLEQKIKDYLFREVVNTLVKL